MQTLISIALILLCIVSSAMIVLSDELADFIQDTIFTDDDKKDDDWEQEEYIKEWRRKHGK